MAEERDEVKKLALELLEWLKALLVLGWRQKIQSRAKVRIAIEDTLDEGLPRAYTKELFVKKRKSCSNTCTRRIRETERVSRRELRAIRFDPLTTKLELFVDFPRTV